MTEGEDGEIKREREIQRGRRWSDGVTQKGRERESRWRDRETERWKERQMKGTIKYKQYFPIILDTPYPIMDCESSFSVL